MIVHHYIISGIDLEREPYLKKEFEKWGLDEKNITWIKGNNKDDLSDEFINSICCNSNNLKRGGIACTYKHYLSLKDIVVNKREYAVIMEDDINFNDYISKRIEKYISELNKYYSDWNVLFDGDINTYYGNIGKYSESTIISNKFIYPKTNLDLSKKGGLAGSTRGCNYYLINLKTAKILYNNFLPFNNIVDHYYNTLFRKFNFKVYWSLPPFVHKIRRKSTAI